MTNNMSDSNSALVIENLTKSYGYEVIIHNIHIGKKIKAVDNVNFRVNKGEIIGFLGPNGAGKTTLIRVILDYLIPESGTIKIFGLDHHKNAVLIRKYIGYVPGDVALYENFTGLELLEYFGKYRSIDKNMLNELFQTFNVDLTQKIRNLSKGNRQQLALLITMASNPDLLIFDEPSSGLDPLIASKLHLLLKKMRDRGKTIFLSSHNLAEVQNICDRVAIIKNGKIKLIESIDELRRKSLQNIIVHFANDSEIPFLNDFTGLRSVSSITIYQKNVYLFKIKGDINEILKLLVNNYTIDHITIEDSSLEDIFLEFYLDENEIQSKISSK